MRFSPRTAFILVLCALVSNAPLVFASSYLVSQNLEDELGDFEQDEVTVPKKKTAKSSDTVENGLESSSESASASEESLEKELDAEVEKVETEKPGSALESEDASEIADKPEQEQQVPPPVVENPVEEAPAPVVKEEVAPAEPPPPVVQEEPKESPVVQEAPTPEPVAAISSAGPDEPNEAFEARLSRIFEKYGGNKMSDVEWEQVAGARLKEKYVIQPGDTLWDISVTLFGNGYFWPKVWQLNSNITNPHDVKPGYTLSFTYGSGTEAPQIQVAQSDVETPKPEITENLVADAGNQEAINETSDGDQPVIPPQEKSGRDVLKKLPNSLPDIFGVPGGGFGSQHVETSERPREYDSDMKLRTFISESPPWSEGQIVDVETGGETANLFQYVFIRFSQPTVSGSYIVFKPREALKLKDSSDVLGYPVEVLGEVQIVDRVEGADNVYRALVTGLVNQLVKNASVIHGSLQTYKAVPTAQKNNVDARIIGGEFTNNITAFMLNSIVFLDQGSAKGLKVDDTLYVYKNFAQRGLSEFLSTTRSAIGQLRIIRVSAQRATAVVVSASDQIQVGDTTGHPAGMVPPSREIPETL